MKLPVVKGVAEEQPWYAEGLSFTCTQCGNCCTGGPGYVWISTIEIGRLAEFLKITPQEVIKKYCRKYGNRYSLDERRNPQGLYDCIFLEERKVPSKNGEVSLTRRVCSIYPVRPLQCRTWPFWDSNLASKENWTGASGRCPGMNRGKLFNLDQIHALRDAPDWPDDPPSSKK